MCKIRTIHRQMSRWSYANARNGHKIAQELHKYHDSGKLPAMARLRSGIPNTAGASPAEILELAKKNDVRFLRLQFTDILGVNKNVEIPASQFEKALDGDIMFDGSSIEGFVRIEESDMLLAPDLGTFQVFPWGDPETRVARLICDINTPDGTPFAGDPRGAAQAADRARRRDGLFTMNAGMEAEFFMFKPRAGWRAIDGDARCRRVLRPRAGRPRRGCAPRDRATCSSRWASRSRRRTTRWRTGSTRSTSAMPMR